MAAPAPKSLLSWLYVGDKQLAKDRALLRRLNVRYILNATPPLTEGGVANFFERERDLTYLRLPLRDSNTERLAAHVPGAVEFLERARIRADGAALIHCNEGKSRSCALALAYLVKTHGKTLAEAQALLRAARPQAEPKLAFVDQVALLAPETWYAAHQDE